jgi:hypothetical protein
LIFIYIFISIEKIIYLEKKIIFLTEKILCDWE